MMKTIEQKAARYDEAIERAKGVIEQNPLMEYLKKGIEYILQELRESEDEKMRKGIIRNLEYLMDRAEGFVKDELKERIAWLEKQGDKDKLIQELGEYKVKYTQGILENHINSMSKKDDERLRKTTISFLKDFAEQGYENAVECIDWLENQGTERKQLYIRFGDMPVNEKSKIYCGKEEIDDENGVSVYPAFELNGNVVLGLTLPITRTTLYTQQNLLEYDDRPCYLVSGDYVGKGKDGEPLIRNVSIIKRLDNYRIKEFEKQGEHKPTDNVESKFHEGEWVVDKKNKEVFNISKKLANTYEIIDIEGNDYHVPHYTLEEEYDLWTIQDAKDGDALAAHGCIVLFKEIDGLNIKCYCTFHYMGFNPSLYIDTLQNKTAFCPATKEQRYLLFQKMKEAGYEWDDKKKLKKIELNSAWSEEDEKRLKSCLNILQANSIMELKKR